MLGSLIMPGRDPLAIFTSLARTYGDIVYFRMGGERVYFVNHPDHIRQVLVTDHAKFGKSRALERARKLLGDGLLTSDGDPHRRRRRVVQPAFHRAAVAGYAETIVEHAQRTVDAWADGEPIDVSAAMMRLTLAIAARALFDVDIESKSDTIGRAMTDVLESFWLTLLPFSDVIEALPLRAVRRSAHGRAQLDALIYEMMAARRASGGRRADVLSSLIGDNEGSETGLTDREIRDEVMTLLLAGHETTANALVWTWYLLSQSPEIAARVHDEVDRVASSAASPVTSSAAFPYVTRVVTESMRLYPPVWTIGRRAKEPCDIGGFRIPAGALVFMSQWTMHRDARFFSAPELFVPERWTPELTASLPKHAYFPFGGGPRHCIGESLAWMELVLIVATTARRWHLTLVPGHPVVTQPLITLRAKHGMRMVPRPRH
jgi:cytochrome P450